MLAKVLLAGALAAVAAAQQVSSVLFFTKVPNPVTAGQPQAITYSTNDSSTPVTILLRKGVSTNLQTVATLTDSATNGQYVWTPAKTLEDASDYALQIQQGDQVNYFGPFTLQGGGQASSSSSSSASSSASASHSSSAIVISPNSTTTSAHPPFATGNGTHPNSTMTKTSTHSTSSTTATTSSGTQPTSSPSGAGFQGTTSSSANPPQNTNAAATIVTGSSAVAIIFGAVAAMLFC